MSLNKGIKFSEIHHWSYFVFIRLHNSHQGYQSFWGPQLRFVIAAQPPVVYPSFHLFLELRFHVMRHRILRSAVRQLIRLGTLNPFPRSSPTLAILIVLYLKIFVLRSRLSTCHATSIRSACAMLRFAVKNRGTSNVIHMHVSVPTLTLKLNTTATNGHATKLINDVHT